MNKKTTNQPADIKKPAPAVPAASVLIVDNRASSRNSMKSSLRRKGYNVQFIEDKSQVLDVLNRVAVDVVIIALPPLDEDKLDVFGEIKAVSPETEVLTVVTEDNLDTALRSVKAGAYHFLTTPFHSDELNLAVDRALEKKRLSEMVLGMEEGGRFQRPLEGFIGDSRAIRDVLKVVRQVARLDSTILVSGENGTGKELVARTLHSLSPRRDMPLAIISCGAIPKDIQETELFGQAGRETPGTQPSKRGLFEEAHGGTVFLDEVGDLSPASQVRMLRLLQNGRITHVGATVARSLDVRIIAATNRNLEECVENETFSEDLFYRLNVVPIHIPALRERPEDIPLLAQKFVTLSAEKMGIQPTPAISPRVMNLLMAQPWPGNIRELECAIERAVALDRDGIIGMDDVPLGSTQRSEDKALERARKSSLTLNELEREYILEVLSEFGGSRKKTAERLGITTATLWRKLKQYEREG
jgi:two-component system response regulator HydG